MKELFHDFLRKIDGTDLHRRTVELCKIEAKQTFPAYNEAADLILSELKKYDIPNAEKIMFTADGKTVYEDKIMPIAWDASIGRLTLCDKENTVAADFETEPFSLIKGSVATEKGGELLHIATQHQMLGGEDVSNCLIMLEHDVFPRQQMLNAVLDAGARGFITDNITRRYDTPDELSWVNGCSEGNHWHTIAQDRDFVAFSVTPRMGDKIRAAANRGGLNAIVESDGRRYVGEFPAVTALLPGEREEEIWLLAHTAEPFLDDDSAGVTAGIEIIRCLKEFKNRKYSVRVIFTLEMYGFAAFHAQFKGRVLGGINLDAFVCANDYHINIVRPTPGKLFHGTDIIEKLYETLKDEIHLELGNYEIFDDMFLSDSTTNIPTIWALAKSSGTEKRFWHNSIQKNENILDDKKFAESAAFIATWAYLTMNGNPADAQDFKIPYVAKESSKWRDYAANQVYKRKTVGLPHDLGAVPKEFRRPLPDSVLYGNFGSVLSRIDGQKNLAQVIADVEFIRNCTMKDSEIKKTVGALNYLTDWGYLEAVKRTALSKNDLVDAIRKAGVQEGDVLLVHASVSNCGYIENGGKTLVEAIMEAVGKSGTALFTAFTYPYAMLGDKTNTNWNFRPYDAKDISQIWTGEISKIILREYPDAVRSKHITHSWVGLGASAEECVSLHKFDDSPTGENSPLGEALRRNGKILFVGSTLAPSTFLHYIEDAFDLPYLSSAVCLYRREDGSVAKALLPKHLPGHRDFYCGEKAINCKFYKKAIERGLQISEAAVGLDKLQLVDLQQLWQIGSQLVQEDNRILLCDDPNCIFCRKF